MKIKERYPISRTPAESKTLQGSPEDVLFVIEDKIGDYELPLRITEETDDCIWVADVVNIVVHLTRWTDEISGICAHCSVIVRDQYNKKLKRSVREKEYGKYLECCWGIKGLVVKETGQTLQAAIEEAGYKHIPFSEH
tara:strand:+ start:368 stop:781 length:414 start_codon:yes stop_codon:yes gene_type:complete